MKLEGWYSLSFQWIGMASGVLPLCDLLGNIATGGGVSVMRHPTAAKSSLGKKGKYRMKKRILVIYQPKSIQIVLATNLVNAGHEVLTCNTPGEALEVLSGLTVAPDLIILSIDYEKEAYNVIQYVQDHLSGASIHFVAAVLQDEKRGIEHTLKGIPISYLIKPFHIQQVLVLVSKLTKPA
jgi:DNA-binding NtrC family response regulator